MVMNKLFGLIALALCFCLIFYFNGKEERAENKGNARVDIVQSANVEDASVSKAVIFVSREEDQSPSKGEDGAGGI